MDFEDELVAEDESRLNKLSKYIDNDLKFLFIDYLKYKQYKYFVAPYEADAQLAYLYKQNWVQVIVTEDSDLIAYGCKKIIKGIRFNGICQYINITDKYSQSLPTSIKKFIELSLVISW